MSPDVSGPWSLIRSERPQAGVILITLARAEKLNALSKDLLREVATVLREAEEDATIGCVVITGEGKAFSAGADIGDMMERGVASYLDPDRLADWRAIEDFPKPLIAAVNGYALGGGLELMLLCDIALAATTARFGAPEINIGSFPGDGGTQRLAQRVGRGLASRMILTGDMIDAGLALGRSLVDEVAEPDALLARSLEIAAAISTKSAVALRLAKAAIRAGDRMTLSEGVAHEQVLAARSFATEDRDEGLRAFKEKRPPAFKGR